MLDTLRFTINDLAFYHAVQKYRTDDLGGIVPARINTTALKEMVTQGKIISLDEYREKNLRELLDDLNEHGLNIVVKDFFQLYSQGSWCRDITLCIDEYNLKIIVEASLPKFYLGQNVDLLYDYRTSVLDFMTYLYMFFRVPCPSAEQLLSNEVLRADICYFYKFQSQIHAFDFISAFRMWTKHKRKKVHHYDSSMMFVGRSYSLKFYMKHNEFQAHDKKFITKNLSSLMEKDTYELQKQIEDYRKLLAYCDFESLGMVRCEFTIRKQKLNYDGVYTLAELLNLDICDYYERLLDKMGVLTMAHTQKDECFNKLKTDKKLLAYAAMLEQFGRDKVKEIYSRNTIYVYDKALEQMGVSLHDFSILKDVTLKVRESDRLRVANTSDNYELQKRFVNGHLF